MNVAVCVKQVPDPAAPGVLDPATRTLVRGGKLLLDESDACGVELGLQLVEAAGGGEVSVVSMGPAGETTGLRNALAMGADRAILVADEALRGSDALSTAKVLARAIARTGADLVVTATESVDGCTGTVPAQIAELLDLPMVTFARKVRLVERTVVAERQTEVGYDEVECPLPALVSVTAGAVEPRYPSFKGIVAAKAKPIDELTVADLGVPAGGVGWAGSRQRIVQVATAEERTAGAVIEDDGDAHLRIMELLEQRGVV
ncbi:MAG: electron transfer flavoprotein subunit beta/FixA family protein [Acidimicrobiia bacterium]|nr:electron transfer flavoprotein subunit beta/FixA family protein [Acidimicrobiia bacterium]